MSRHQPSRRTLRAPSVVASLRFWTLAIAGLSTTASALELGMPFSDNAVFQQQIPLPVWGTSRPEAKTTTANQGGKWRVDDAPINQPIMYLHHIHPKQTDQK